MAGPGESWERVRWSGGSVGQMPHECINYCVNETKCLLVVLPHPLLKSVTAISKYPMATCESRPPM